MSISRLGGSGQEHVLRPMAHPWRTAGLDAVVGAPRRRRAAIRRAARLGDGWLPIGARPPAAASAATEVTT
ncbi:MAG: hypothetical protein M3442_15680 [Chloroflexota bacterium]|nr:hypothetical protein [Chloroflexota bacterium]